MSIILSILKKYCKNYANILSNLLIETSGSDDNSHNKIKHFLTYLFPKIVNSKKHFFKFSICQYLLSAQIFNYSHLNAKNTKKAFKK